MDLSDTIFLDIETVPPEDGPVVEAIRANVQPPASYKKPESIAAWMAENADAVAAEQVSRLALDGLYGSIVVIGFAIGGGTPVIGSASDGNERALIQRFFEMVEEFARKRADGASLDFTVVGHNVEFDLRFLLHRAVKHGLTVPQSLRRAFHPEKGRYHVHDTMKLWSGWKGYVKLRELDTQLFGTAQDDIDGSEVGRLWKSEPAKVMDHCALDVERVRRVYCAIAVTLGL